MKNVLPDLHHVIDNSIIEKICNFANDYIVDKEKSKTMKYLYCLLFNILKTYILNVIFF